MTELETEERIKNEVVKTVDISRSIADEEVKEVINSCILAEAEKKYIPIKNMLLMETGVFNSVRRYDILSELLEDDEVSEIMINGTKSIFIEKNGRIEEYSKHFSDNVKLMAVIQKIVASNNKMINEKNPISDAILSDGSRVNIVLGNISLGGPVVTIRKFPKKDINMQKLIELGSIDQRTAGFLELLVKAGYNIFISGGTGAGKTTFLNALSEFIPSKERVITIEDTAELKIQGIKNLVRLETRNANVEGEDQISIRDLIKTSLRMRPDRLIIGEVRDGAAFDMLTAMNTGHDGSLSTGHANSVHDMLRRLESMSLMAANLPYQAIKEQIASAIDIVIQLGKLRDGQRRTLEICEVTGVADGEFTINPLFEFHETEEKNGRVYGELKQINNLINTSKLSSAGLLSVFREEGLWSCDKKE